MRIYTSGRNQHSRGVAGEEVVLSLSTGQFAYWWEDTVGITGKHYDVAGMCVGNARDPCIRDVLDWIGATSVLGGGNVVIIWQSVQRIKDNILENGTKSDGVENFGLLPGGMHKKTR